MEPFEIITRVGYVGDELWKEVMKLREGNDSQRYNDAIRDHKAIELILKFYSEHHKGS